MPELIDLLPFSLVTQSTAFLLRTVGMLRRTGAQLQLQKQLLADSMAYSSAFAARNARPVDPYQMATSLYSPAATHMARRKFGGQRQQEYTKKMRLVADMHRSALGMSKDS